MPRDLPDDLTQEEVYEIIAFQTYQERVRKSQEPGALDPRASFGGSG